MLSLSAWAAERPGEISGYVRDAAGIPQMGAVVEIVGTAARTLTVFTDGTGFYSATDLLPGLYTVKVSVASFLPAWRDKVGLHPGTNTHLNVTLNTLLNGMRVGPLRGNSDDDDWKWTLRSVANRPVLRVFDDPSSGDKQGPELKGSLSFLAGSAAEGYGSGSEMSTGFSIERSIFSVDRVGLKGNVGYGDGVPAAVLRANYSHSLPDGSGPSMGIAIRRFAPSDPNLHNASLQAMALTAGRGFLGWRRAGAEVRQRIADHPISGTGERIPAPRIFGLPPLPEHDSRAMATPPRCPTVWKLIAWIRRQRI